MSELDDLATTRADNARLLKGIADAKAALVPKDGAQDFANLEEKMARRHAVTMKHTRLQTSGPLPLETRTTEFMPVGKADQYRLGWDGVYRLEYLHSDDTDSFDAHQSLIAASKLRVLPPGQTPESMDIKAAQNAAVSAAIVRATDAREARERETARLAAKASAMAEVNRRFGTAR